MSATSVNRGDGVNRKIGLVSAGIVTLSVAVFAVSMLLEAAALSYISCILLAAGYIGMTAAFVSYAKDDTKAAQYCALAFAVIYAVFVMAVYYAQITTVSQHALSDQASYLINYEKFGLFFAYDLFGYAMLAISTFFVGLTITAKKKETKVLKALLMLHGLFAVCCIFPALGMFNTDTSSNDKIGVVILELWCLYFIPIGILSYRHFKCLK